MSKDQSARYLQKYMSKHLVAREEFDGSRSRVNLQDEHECIVHRVYTEHTRNGKKCV